jgi:hypothetical protein
MENSIMKNNELLDKMELIDPEYIAEAERYSAQRLSAGKKNTVKRLYLECAALAACLIIGICSGYGALTGKGPMIPMLGIVKYGASDTASSFSGSAAPLFVISFVFLLVAAALVFLIRRDSRNR